MVLGAKNKRIIFVATLLVSLATFLVAVFSSNKFNTEALTPTDTTKSLTITKVWANDEAVDRPDLNGGLTVHIEKTTSTLIPGNSLENKMKSLAGSGSTNTDNQTINAIVKASDAKYEAIKGSLTSDNEVQDSGEKTYMWFESSTGTLYFYSEADNIYLNADSGGTFRKMKKLTNISGLAHFNTTYVTDMNRIFQDTTTLVDLSPLAGWDTGGVTNFRFAFGANTPATMSYTSLEALSNWNVASAVDMNQMFKGSKHITSLSSLSNWNVQNVEDMNQMFNYAGNIAGSLDASNIADWDVKNVTNFGDMFNNTPSSAVKPIFTKRPGSWSGGTYNPSSGAAGTPVSVNTKTPTSNSLTCSNWTDNGDNTWTCTIAGISNDGAIYKAWEDPIHGYQGSATQANPVIIAGNDETLAITNTLVNGHSINVKKMVSGTGADQTQDFSFTFNVYDENGVLNNHFTQVITAKHGETVHLATIPEDYSYIITEAGTDYTASYRITNFSDGVAISHGSGTSTGTVSPNESQLITFTNHRDDATKKIITITKSWVDDVPAMRPNDVTVYLNKTSSTLIAGSSLRSRMVSLAGGASNIKAIKVGTTPPSGAAEIQDSSSSKKTYMWYDNNTIYISSEADNIYANADMANAFNNLTNLTDVSGLSVLNTTYVTSMDSMFQGTINLENIDALANWDVGNVKTMHLMFNSGLTSGSGPFMKINSLSALANWNTQKVENMGLMFKGCLALIDPSPIQDWNVKNVTNMNQMFFRTGLTTTAGLENWEPERVTNFSSMFGNLNNATTTIALPSFKNRPGTWTSNSGSYSNTTTQPGSAPTTTKTQSPDQQTTNPGGWIKNNDNTWTYEFVVSDDKSIYTAWENPVPDKYTSTTYDIDHSVLVADYAATITNTLKTYEVTLKKLITGNMADLNDDFDFELKVYNENNKVISDYTKNITLQHGDNVKYKLPQGYKYSVDEADPDPSSAYARDPGYREFVEVTKTTGGATVVARTESLTTNQVTLTEDQTVLFINNKEEVPVTGVFHNKTPFAIIVAIGVSFMTGYTCLSFIRRFKPNIIDG